MSYSTNTNLTLAANDLMGALKQRTQLAAFYFTDLERAIVKATNRDVVVPKGKHVRSIISASFDSGAVADILKLLQKRLHDEWMISLKSLILIHYLMREGSTAAVMNQLGYHPELLNLTGYHDTSSGGLGMEQTKNITLYAAYLEERVYAHRDLKTDIFVESVVVFPSKKAPDILARLDCLLRLVEKASEARFFLDSINNDVTTEVVRLIVKELMKTFQFLNEGVVLILKQFFELPKDQAKNALAFYKKFVTATEKSVDYFNVIRKVQSSLGISIPEITHAPLSLVKSLQDYVDSGSFENPQKQTVERAASQASSFQQPSTKEPLFDVFSSRAPVVQPASQVQDDLFAAFAQPQSNARQIQGTPSSNLLQIQAAPSQAMVVAQHLNTVAPLHQHPSFQSNHASQQPPLQQQSVDAFDFGNPHFSNAGPAFPQNQMYMQPGGSFSQPIMPSHQNNNYQMFNGGNSMQPQQQGSTGIYQNPSGMRSANNSFQNPTQFGLQTQQSQTGMQYAFSAPMGNNNVRPANNQMFAVPVNNGYSANQSLI